MPARHARTHARTHTCTHRYLKGKGGGIVVFSVKGGRDIGSKFIESLKLFRSYTQAHTRQARATERERGRESTHPNTVASFLHMPHAHARTDTHTYMVHTRP